MNRKQTHCLQIHNVNTQIHELKEGCDFGGKLVEKERHSVIREGWEKHEQSVEGMESDKYLEAARSKIKFLPKKMNQDMR